MLRKCVSLNRHLKQSDHDSAMNIRMFKHRVRVRVRTVKNE